MASFYENGLSQPNSQSPPSSRVPIPLIVLTLLVIPALLAFELVSGKEFQVTAIVFAAIGGLVIIARPFWGLVFFVALLYTRPEESIPTLAGMRLPLMVSLVTLTATIFQKLLNRESLTRTPMNGMILGFGLAVIASAIPHGNASIAAQDIARLVILVFLVLNLVTTPARYRQFTTVLIVFTGYLAAYASYLYFAGGALIEHGVLRSQATGIFSDPNDLSATIAAGLGLTLFRTRSAKKGAQSLYAIICILFVWAIILTHSRGGMLALLAVVGCFIYASISRKIIALIVAAIIAGPLLLLGSGRMTNFDSGEESANSRFWFWSNGVEKLIQHPLLGVGYGSFPDINNGMTAHNSYVLCFTETGFIGYFFWMGCVYYAFQRRQLTGDDINMQTSSTNFEDNFSALERAGSYLAFSGFLVAIFWISRTYVPIFYLLVSLPSCQKIASTKNEVIATQYQLAQKWDWLRIFLLCIASITFIYAFALCMR